MELGNQRASGNVEDRRGLGVVGGSFGVGGALVALVAYFFGFDPGTALQIGQQVGGSRGEQQQVAPGTPADAAGQFVSKVLGSTEDVWGRLFQGSNRQYQAPTLVLFERQVKSACGMGQSAMGPFYCPADQKLYLDLSFFRDLQTRFGAPGDFAQAYVIAHEVGHHVQNITGAFQKMEQARGRVSKAEMNQLSVRMELMADCYAGVWGFHAGAMKQLSEGDIAEALAAASAIGDDRLQQRGQGRVVPESFTHGSAEQRTRWFKRGMEAGRAADCDTFNASAL